LITYLDSADLLLIATSACDGDLVLRDPGLLDAAAHRPKAFVLGAESYPTLWLKVAAMLDSIVRTRPLAAGNWRLGWLAAVAMCDLNGWWVDADDDIALDLVRRVSRGAIEVSEVANCLESWAKQM
jgi:death on curing protein